MPKTCRTLDCQLNGYSYEDDNEISVCPICQQALTADDGSSTFGESGSALECIVLVEVNTRKEIVIPLEGGVIGRSSPIGDGLFAQRDSNGKLLVSDPHCRIFTEDGVVYVDDIGDSSLEGSTNGTYVGGGDRIPKNTPTPLTQGVRLAIAHLKFDVALSYALAKNPDAKEEIMIWVIQCPECGELHKVESKEIRIEVCSNCPNAIDAEQIESEKPMLMSEDKYEEWKSRV